MSKRIPAHAIACGRYVEAGVAVEPIDGLYRVQIGTAAQQRATASAAAGDYAIMFRRDLLTSPTPGNVLAKARRHLRSLYSMPPEVTERGQAIADFRKFLEENHVYLAAESGKDILDGMCVGL